MVTFNIFRDVDASLPPKNNSFWDFLSQRQAISLDPMMPITESCVNFTILDRTIILEKRANNSLSFSPGITDGFTVAPFILKGDEPSTTHSYQDKTRDIVFKGDVLISFSYPNSDVDDTITSGFFSALETIVSQQFPGRVFLWAPPLKPAALSIREPKTILTNLGPGSPLEPTYRYHKLIGSDPNKNSTGVMIFAVVFFNFDEAIYNKYATDLSQSPQYLDQVDRYLSNNDPLFAEPSSIRNEGSLYTNTQFILDSIAAFKNLFLRVDPAVTFTVQGE